MRLITNVAVVQASVRNRRSPVDPPEPGLQVPANLRTISVLPNQVVLAWDDTNNGAVAYQVYRGSVLLHTTVAGGTGFTDSTVTPGSVYIYEVRTVGMASGPTRTVNVPSGGTVEPLYEDNFETATIGQGIIGRGGNGFSWGHSRASIISTENSYSGTRSLRMSFGPTEPNGDPHWWAEQRFAFPEVAEFWVEFMWFVPDNYYHHTVTDEPSNNKLFAWWGPPGYSVRPSGVFSMWGKAGGESNLDVARYGSDRPNDWRPRVPGNQDRHFLDSSHHGRWHRIRVHVKTSDVGQSNGVMRLWRDDELVVYVYDDANDGGNPATNFASFGYLMGYDNGRYTEDTHFYVDDFKFWVNDPGWDNPPVEPLFHDDFESYPDGGSVSGGGGNGFSWGGSRATSVSTERSLTGTRSLKMSYGPVEPNGDPHWWAEQRFSHPQVKEYWIEFYWYVPENYYHVPGNNKFFSWWGPNRDNSVIPPSGTFQTWERYPAPNTGGHSIMRVNTWGPSGEHYPRVPGNQNRLFLTESHRGQWHRIRIYVRISDVGQSNGIARLWRGNDLIVDVVGDDNNNTDPAVNLMQHGYLMGYDNGRYTEDTHFYVDDFKFWVNDPGWGE